MKARPTAEQFGCCPPSHDCWRCKIERDVAAKALAAADAYWQGEVDRRLDAAAERITDALTAKLAPLVEAAREVAELAGLPMLRETIDRPSERMSAAIAKLAAALREVGK